MNREDKLVWINRWADVLNDANAQLDPVIELLRLPPEGPITEALWNTQTLLTQAVSRLVDDQLSWLRWYAHENQMGLRGHPAGFGGNKRPIKTLDDLLWLVEGKA